MLYCGIPFKTKSGNRYLCARTRRQVIFCHPVIHHLAELGNNGVDLEAWLYSVPESGIELKDAGHFSRKELRYCYEKYRFLEKFGYVGGFDFEKHFGLNLEPVQIEHALANVRHVIFEATDACNLRCEYCGYGKFYKDYDKRRNIKLEPRAARQLLSFLRQGWQSGMNTSVNSRIAVGFYGGEPLLNFSFIREIVRYVKSRRFSRHKITFVMTTNALLLAKYMDFLYENRFELLISLDGNAENNAYRRFPDGTPAFEHIIRNVKALRDKYPEYFREKVNFNAVFHNRSSLKEIYAFFKNNFEKRPMISELNLSGIDPEQQDAFWATYADINDDFEKLGRPKDLNDDMFMDLPSVNNLSKFIHHYTDCSFKDYNEIMAAGHQIKRLPTGTCIPFLRKIFLTVNNKILPCERIGQQYALGRIAGNRVDIDPQGIARMYNLYYRRIAARCRLCYMADSCMQCMLNLELDKKKPRCSAFSNYENRRSQLAVQLDCLEENPSLYTRIVKEVGYN